MAHAMIDNLRRSSDGPAAARAWFDFPSAISALSLLVLSLNPGGVRAAVTVPGAPGVQVIPADEVLKDHTVTAPDGTLLFTDWEGVTWRLITDPSDPEITNPSADGFYPADWNAVVSTLDALPDDFLWTTACVVYVLPYPRSGALSSSATDRAIYLSPGVQPLEDGPVLRSTVAHEYGHVVHYTLLPDGDVRWDVYRKLRGIEDESTFYANAAHAYRPHEIFAEDFRVLFGDPVAAGDGSVENPELDSPQYDADLIEFFESLPGLGATADVAEARVPQASWQVFPNPAPLGGQVVLQRTGGEAAVDGEGELGAILVDASGRRAGELQLAPDGAGRWSASLADVAGLRAGAYWLVLRNADGTARSVSLRVIR
ncbi:MAG: hypothetical protein R3E97_03425 [Candidatus Eisenbacteria bacterium]